MLADDLSRRSTREFEIAREGLPRIERAVSDVALAIRPAGIVAQITIAFGPARVIARIVAVLVALRLLGIARTATEVTSLVVTIARTTDRQAQIIIAIVV